MPSYRRMPARGITSLAFGTAIVMTIATTSNAQIHVDGGIGTPGLGGTWSTAYKFLPDAIGAAGPGDEIWVKTGTYKPDDDDRTVSFALTRGIRILGGFAGTEDDADERDIASNPTILDGDLEDDDTSDFGDREDNSYHVVRVTVTEDWDPEEDEVAVLDGLVIRGGNADGSDFDAIGGGVLLLDESSEPSERIWLLLQSTRLTDNSADGGGGGLCAYETAVEFRDSFIDGNRALGLTNSLRVYGGAGFYAGAVRSTRTVLDANRAFNSGGGGAAIESIWLGVAESYFVNTEFIANRAGDAGGGVAVRSGVVELANCLAAGNHVELDSGSAFAAVAAGGGLAFTGGDVVLVNSTVADNTAVNNVPHGFDFGVGGGIYGSLATVRIRNAVVWGNSVIREGTSGPEVTTSHLAQLNVFPNGAPLATASLAFSNVENYVCGNCPNPSPDYQNIGDNASKHDPLFNAPGAWDYRHRNAAMTDAGNDDEVPDDVNDADENGITAEVLPIDLSFGPRLIAIVDMGAYEWCLGDFDFDGTRDGADLGILLNNWGNPGIGDLDGDGTVDGADLGLLLNLWNVACPTENEPAEMLLLGDGGFEALYGDYVDELLETWGFETWSEFLAWLDTLEGWEVVLILEDLL